MNAGDDHLSPEELTTYVAGAVSDDLIQRVEQHIFHCDLCARAVNQHVHELVKSEKLRALSAKVPRSV